MNTRRSTRSHTKALSKNEDEQETNIEIQSRKRQKSKFDSSDDDSSADNNPAENVFIDEEKEQENIQIKPKDKRIKFDSDVEDNSSDDEKEQNTSNTSQSRKRPVPKLNSDEDGSSSDSSVGDYLKTADEIDLNSSFFKFEDNNKEPLDFDDIEKKMFSGIKRLSESEESDNDEVESTDTPEIMTETSNSQSSSTRNNFSQIREYNKKLEEAKACVEKYKTKKVKEYKKLSKVENNVDINQLLSVGETRNRESIDSSQNDFDTDDEMDWEEIEENIEEPENTVKIPKEGVQITVELPNVIRKKTKGVDLMAAIKRRINRIKKENQVYVHKVHLLCWIAHGNFINNSVLNNEILLSQALSLLPSEQCYPPKHADMKYLEQIVRWYGKIMKLQETSIDNQTPIKEQLNQQISKKQATCKRNFILLFIIILRSLGLQCRLVLSFQCLPLRPSNSELCSLSTKESKINDKAKEKETIDNSKPSTSKESNTRSKSSTSKPPTVNTSIKNKLNKSLNNSIKNKLNQSLNSSKPSNITKDKRSVKFVEDSKNVSGKSTLNKSTLDKSTVDKSTVDKSKSSSKKKPPTVNTSIKNKLNKALNDSIKNKLNQSLNTSQSSSNVTKNKPVKFEDNKNISRKSTSDKQKINSSTNIKSEKKKDKSSSESQKLKTTSRTRYSKKLSLKEKLDKNLEDDIKSPIKEENDITELEDFVPSTSKKISLKKNVNKTLVDSKSEINKVKLKNLSVKLDTILEGGIKSPIKEENIKKEFKGFASRSSTKTSLGEKLKKNLEDSKLEIKNVNLEESPVKLLQVDGADDSPPPKSKPKSSKKLNISTKLNKNLNDLDTDFNTLQRFPRQARNKPVKYIDSESAVDSDFHPNQGTSSPAKSPIKDLNQNKKSDSSTKKKSQSKAISNESKRNLSEPSTSKGRSNNTTNSNLDVRGDIINLLKGHMAEQRHNNKSKTVKKSSTNSDSDYDSDFAPSPIINKRKSSGKSGKKVSRSSEYMSKIEVNSKVKRRVKPRSELDRRALSSDEEDSQDLEKKKKLGIDFWVEVFLEEEEKWISADLIKGQVHCVSELYNRASHPVSYIVAWNNNLSLKDITARYCPNWNTVTRKLRVDSVWWNQTLKPFIGVKTARDKEEDEDLARQQFDKPLPTTISEYKNHPLYALKRHLLKFQAIYPPDAMTLGFVRKEAVYARECVQTLHSREIWVKHAKVVKPGQEPYKIVKARPKYDKLTGNFISDLPLELFGNWQIQDYDPPTAENGVVPRNAFGNVELFKACMLPKKTVHLQLPCLNKVARKLQIDCAPAVVGFDYHCGGSHPTFDGYVVCEEFKDVLIAAWEEDQEETAKREQEKYEKRVYGNWRKLIKGLLIRERLKARYDFGAPSSPAETSKAKAKPSKPKKIKN